MIPMLYVVFQSLREWTKRKFRGRRPSAHHAAE